MVEIITAFAPAARISGEALQRQAQYFENPALSVFTDAVPDILMVLNQQRQVVFTNRKLVDVLGLADPGCALGQRPGELFDCIHASETEGGCGTTESCSTCGAVRAIMNGLAGKTDVQDCRIIQRSTNNPLDLRVYATPLQVAGEQYTFFSVMDIGHEKRRHALERIFFHDILNTAGGLRGMVFMLDKASSEEELKEIKKDLDFLSEELIDEINAQRQLLAAENNELIPQFDPLHSLDTLSIIIGFYQGYDVAKGKHILLDEQIEDVTFYSDRTLLRRVLGNMLKNALEASAPGETITLGCQKVDGEVCFWVHNPHYIPRDIRLQIFQRSFSSKGSGRGLGTYSMKLLGERYLKGKVSFTSTPLAGTVFQIFLPILVDN